MTREDASRYVEEKFLSLAETECHAIGIGGDTGGRQYSAALKWMQEWQLAGWVSDQNHRLGLAPTAEAIWNARASIHMKLHGDHVARDLAPRSRRRWVQQWRMRWGGRVGKIPVGERHMDVAVAHKAGHSDGETRRKFHGRLGVWA